MTQSTVELIVMIVLEKSSIKDVKMDQKMDVKMRKMFNLRLFRGKDKMTHIRAIANSLISEGYITIFEEADRGSLTCSDVQIAKEIALEYWNILVKGTYCACTFNCKTAMLDMFVLV